MATKRSLRAPAGSTTDPFRWPSTITIRSSKPLEITPQPDGTLALLSNGQEKMTAVRPAEARAKGLPEPVDPAHHTWVQNPAEKFHFRAPDLSGRMVSDDDPQFRNKVVIVA